MDDFLSKIIGAQVQDAKKRIWNRMESKLPERGVGAYQEVLSTFHLSKQELDISSLKRVQGKERLLNILPERETARVPLFVFSRRAWAAATLSFFFAFLFVPVFQMPHLVSAATYNMLEVVQGEAYVNGVPVIGEVFVQTGDLIHTADGAMAHIEFVDDSRVTLGPNSGVSIVAAEVDSGNKAKTEVVLKQIEGRIWVQTLNLMNGSSLIVNFDEGQVISTSRSSFDLQVDWDESTISVARNLLGVRLDGGDDNDFVYEGTIGQGARLLASTEFETSELTDGEMSDVWWDFNLAYGKIHARTLEEKYKDEAIEKAIILPGNPLYVFKTFRETVKETLTFSSEGKEELAAEQAENRLDEAQVFIQRGDFEGAAAALDKYEETVEEKLQNTDNEELLVHLDEVQKSIIGQQELNEGDELLAESIVETSAAISSDPADKNETRMLSVSQKLSMVPDLIEIGEFESALEYLSTYQEDSISMLVQLEEVELEDRELIVSALLEEKLKNLQQLRIINSMLDGDVELNTQVYEEMSMMTLSLRERALDQLSSFFTETEYDSLMQQDVYERLQDSSEMNEELSDQFEALEEELADAEFSDNGIVIDLELVPEFVEDIGIEIEVEEMDPRFDFTNESQKQK